MIGAKKQFDPILLIVTLFLLSLPIGWTWNLTLRAMYPDNIRERVTARHIPMPPPVAVSPAPPQKEDKIVVRKKEKAGYQVVVILSNLPANQEVKELKILHFTVDGISVLPSEPYIVPNLKRSNKMDSIFVRFDVPNLKTSSGSEVMCELSYEYRYRNGNGSSSTTKSIKVQ